jgi:hypothetical protein
MVAVFVTVWPHVVLSFLLLRPRQATIRAKKAMTGTAIVAILAALERPSLFLEVVLGEEADEGWSVVVGAVDGGLVESTVACKAVTASRLVVP